MKIRVARRAGFCWGVHRAMDVALEAAARFRHRGPVQMLGPLIHNPQALSHLARRGIRLVDEAADLEDGTVIIRAHGVPLQDLSVLTDLRRSKRIRITNGTCPEVAKVQSLIRRQAAKGGSTIILGQATHAEVEAHRSFATAGCDIIDTLEEAQALPQARLEGALVVAQTTFSVKAFQEITSHLEGRSSSLIIRNTICPDTHLRQDEAQELARSADAVVVVGGRDSNNTRHLVESVRTAGKPVQWIESVADLDLEALRGLPSVGVLAGASTPNWTVDEAVEALEQADHPSRRRLLGRLVRTLQAPLALGLGAIALLLHQLLGWSTGNSSLVLVAAFHLHLCALSPYLDPAGLDAKGQRQEEFLAGHRRLLMSLAALAGLAAALAAHRQGPAVLAGAVLLAIMALAYQRGWLPGLVHRLPAVKDMGQALIPALLIVGLPWLQGRSSHAMRLWTAFGISFALALAAHGLRHLSAFREDRVLGREILPVAIGSTATRRLAAVLILLSAGAICWLIRPR